MTKDQKPTTLDDYVVNIANIEDEQPAGSMAIYNDKPSFTADDITPPMIRLAQGLTQEVQSGTAKPGQWLIPGCEPFDSVTVVPLMFAKRRENRDDEGHVLCMSNDSIHGIGDPGGSCEQCVKNQWVNKDKGKNTPPECTFIYSYIVYAVEADTNVLLQFKRTSIGIGRMMNAMVAQHGFRNVAISLESNQSSGKKGTYFMPKIAPISGEKASEALLALQGR